MDNWVNIFNSADTFDVELIKAHLESEFGIVSVIKNQQDSVYTSFNATNVDNSAQLFVREEDKEKALEYINYREKS